MIALYGVLKGKNYKMIESSVLKEVIIKFMLGLANSPVLLLIMLLVLLFSLIVVSFMKFD